MSKLINQIKDNFTQIPNQIIRDNRLRWIDKGVFSYLASRPSQWDFNLSEIQSHSTDGLNALRESLKRLEQFGYLERRRSKNDRNQFDGWDYIVKIPDVGKTLTWGKHDTNNTEYNNNTDIDTNVSINAQATPSHGDSVDEEITYEPTDDEGNPITQKKKKKSKATGIIDTKPNRKLLKTAKDTYDFVGGSIEHYAGTRLVKKHGYEQVLSMLHYSQKIRSEEFAPQVRSLTELERKWIHLSDYQKKHGDSGVPPEIEQEIIDYITDFYKDRPDAEVSKDEINQMIEKRKQLWRDTGSYRHG